MSSRPDTPALPAFLRIHQYAGLKPGPRLLVTAAVHGNEVCGVAAIQRVMAELDSGALQLRGGTLSFIPIVNPLAHQLGRREGDRNLNRNLRPPVVPQDFEDRIAGPLCRWLADHEVLLDLHSFQGQGKPFAMLGPRNNRGELEPFAHEQAEGLLAACVGTERIVEGWLSTYALGLQRRAERAGDGSRRATLQQDPHYGVGTTEYMRSRGGYGITLECGQHADPEAPEFAYKAILRVLVLLGMVDAEVVAPRPASAPELLQLYEVVDREHEGDRFERAWASFDPVIKGQRIGTRHDGTPVLAPADGRIVFPAVNAQPGSEWFYLARASTRQLG
ncbi:MAG: succinylglutamate desuccinylase/aspartoacylase family protein [Roseateles asaccharophilus]|uniref:Putative deacylase n=1 Tax=Roseateles asaccharophilus TaxID=582607 RepID=A0A4R6N8F1_9BURK|nr:succinylglutamate desuccinylase/aspartoacylase family protein [Roseateles asaccharophilus]MDN3544473.1 succinylglutamate desuccinylase/aspartoacylase family protein [Roseateles asaccharophilus]TDP09761.1 putative deacylase [Roseateles asaccharophilus]